MRKKSFRIALLTLGATLLVACANTEQKIVEQTENWSAKELYEQAREHVRDKEWKSARGYLSSITIRHPYSSYAQQALIDQAYISWKDEEPEKAKASIDRFLTLYPSHPGTDYMLYLKGLITFTPPSAFLTSYTGQDPSERDPIGLRESYAAFSELIERFPDSRYASDARQRLTWLVSTIAANETNIAQYYYERDGYVAAINRAQAVLSDFEGVDSAERALYIMMKSYEKLGLADQANDARTVLDHNYPDSSYHEKGLNQDDVKWYTPAYWLRN